MSGRSLALAEQRSTLRRTVDIRTLSSYCLRVARLSTPPIELVPRPLFEAAWKGQSEVVALLIQKGASVKAVNSESGATPLHEAAAKGHADVAELLIAHGAEPSVKDKNGATPLDRALQYRHAKTVAVFLDRGSQGGSRAAAGQLQEAVLRGQPDMVAILLDRGIDPNSGFLLHDAALKGLSTIAEMLIAHGAKVNAVNAAGATPLHDAALAGNDTTIEMLLDKGADINARDIDTDAMPLHNAASWGRAGAVRLLLKRGADAGIANKSGSTPLQAAVENGNQEIARILTQVRVRK